MPAVGALLNLDIPVVRHPFLFYAHILRCDQDDSFDELKDALFKLNQDMSTYYSAYACPKSDRPFVPGEIVAAQHADQHWYRARIIHLMDEDEEFAFSNDQGCIERVRVFYVDYGHSDTIDSLCLREMKPAFLQLPFQAVECTLAKVLPKDSSEMQWSRAATEEFRRLTNTQGGRLQLKAKLLSDTASRLELQLAYSRDAGRSWRDVGEELVSKGLAATAAACVYQPATAPASKVLLQVFPG